MKPDARQRVAALVCGRLDHEYEAISRGGEITMKVIEHDGGMRTAVPARGQGTVVLGAHVLQQLIMDAIAYYGVTASRDAGSCMPCRLRDQECETHAAAAARIRDYLGLLTIAATAGPGACENYEKS